MEWGFHDGRRGFHVEGEWGFHDGARSCAVDTWGFHVEGGRSFMVVQNKEKLFHFGPGRAHSGALLGGHERASRPWLCSFIVESRTVTPRRPLPC
jgi:hypothetical protein